MYYYINYETGITALGQVDLPYVYERGYTLVTKDEYDIANKKWKKEHPVVEE